MKELKNERIGGTGTGCQGPGRFWSARYFFILSFFIIFISFVSCTEALNYESPVPEYNVRYSCNVSTINAAMGQTYLPNLDCQPGVVMVNQYTQLSDVIGVCGLLLYHAATEDAFYAYDLACPYCYKHNSHRPITMKDPFTAQCADCESEFGAVQYGSPAPTAGPANKENLHLRQYRARMASYNTLVVSR